MIMGKVDDNKKQKKHTLLRAAFQLQKKDFPRQLSLTL